MTEMSRDIYRVYSNNKAEKILNYIRDMKVYNKRNNITRDGILTIDFNISLTALQELTGAKIVRPSGNSTFCKISFA